MFMSGGIVVDVVWAIAAVLLLLSAWAIITGRDERYYRQFRRHGLSPDRRLERQSSTKGAKRP